MNTTQTLAAAPHLSAFLCAHAGFRAGFAEIASVLAAPRDPRHAALVEDQAEFLLGYLHHHHSDEDAWLWPRLAERAPHAEPVLDVLEEQHQQIDPDIAVAGDTSRPRAERAAAFARLHETINRHLDDEERTAVPLAVEHITAAEWMAHEQDVIGSYDRKRLPLLFSWACAHADPALVRHAIAEQPMPVRLLFRLFWYPSYRRRHQELFGTALRRRADRA